MNHANIDRRSLRMAQAVASKIDKDPSRLLRVRQWLRHRTEPAYLEWARILEQPWEQVRAVLLQDDEEGRRLRQSTPFVGILTPQERWSYYRA